MLYGARAVVRYVVLGLMILCSPLGLAEDVPQVRIVLEESPEHPFIACTTEELARLREAYAGDGAKHKVVASRVKAADTFVGVTVDFPPRGGQHNQWYQCEDCQFGLKTIDDTHHQCPKCEKVYSGYPYDDCVFRVKHYKNLSSALSAAWAYAITQDEKYAAYTAEVLLGYAERYRNYPYHCNKACKDDTNHSKSGGYLYEQTLGEASGLSIYIAPAYDLIHDASVLSEADHALIKEGLLLPMLANLDRTKSGRSNWQSWHNAGMLMGGALVGEAHWIEKSIYAEGNGFLEQMKISVMPEGMWYENSWGYHFYSLSSLTILAEGARRLGVDIWDDETFKKMFMVPVQYRMANNSLPRFGDDVNSYVPVGGTRMEQAYHAYQDPALLAMLSSTPTFESVLLGREVQAKVPFPERASEVLPGAGHAILRNHGEAGLSAALTFGPYGGGHGHYDKLSFVFFGYGKELGVDPGRAKSQAYRLPIHKNWYKATVSHNTVLVDGVSQEPAQGKLDFFETNDRYTAVSARCDVAYPGVTYMRTLVMLEDCLVVVDQLEAEKARRFDWVYHNRGEKVVCDVAKRPVGDEAYAGEAYINNVMVGETDGPIGVQFVDEGVTTRLTMAGHVDTKVFVGDGVGATVLERVPVTMIAREGKQVTFVAVLEPVKDGEVAGVTGVSVEAQGDGQLVSVERGDGTVQISIKDDGTVKF